MSGQKFTPGPQTFEPSGAQENASNGDTGGPAFPVMPPVDETGRSAVGYPCPSEGASLRDYFAAKAMQALIGAVQPIRGIPLSAKVSERAYQFADAMLAAREAKS